jgi:spore maturation protein SpmB
MEKAKMNIIDMFVKGARNGWNIAINSLLPNVILAFTLIKILQVTGIMNLIGLLCAPVMGLFGLPGQAITVNMTALLSQGGAVGVLAGLLSSGSLNAREATILLPAVFASGGVLQNIGRVLGTAGVNTKHYGVVLCMTILNGILAMMIMSVLSKFF